MKKSKTAASPSADKNRRTNIRMSKLGRSIQSSTAETNWGEMVKMLFEADPNGGRKAENRRLISLRSRSPESTNHASYSNDQMQYILFLMLIVSTAEKRIQELYRKEFSDRCDAISKQHGLKEDEYWPEGKEPEEWQNLNKEFEQQAIRIHLKTLREYHQDEIADMVEADGLEELFAIMTTIRSQFVTMLKNFQGTSERQLGTDGAIPEMLQSRVLSPRR